jgi:hypothetical protein
VKASPSQRRGQRYPIGRRVGADQDRLVRPEGGVRDEQVLRQRDVAEPRHTVSRKTGRADGAIFVDRLTKRQHRV